MKWKVKVVLLEASSTSFFRYGQMEVESGVTRSIIDELHSGDIDGDQMEGENGVTQSVIDELINWDIQGEKMECESGVT